MIYSILKFFIYMCFIVMIILLIKNIYYSFIIYKYKYINVNNCLNIIDTGDLILFKCDIKTNEDKVIQLNSYFSHCGMIIVINNKKYILEMVRQGDHDNLNEFKSNVNLIDFKKRVTNYKGNVYLVKCSNVNLIEFKNNIIENIHKYMDYKYDMNIIINYIKSKFNLNNNTNDKHMFCSEFHYHVLSESGLVEPIKNKKIMTPLDIFNLSIYIRNIFIKYLCKILM